MPRRKCEVCGEWCGEHKHQLREKDFEILREKHCVDSYLKSRLKVTSTVCCRHFEFHEHNSHSRKQIRVLTEFCTPNLLGREDLAFQESQITPPKKKRKLGKRVESILATQTMVQTPNIVKRETRSLTSSPLYSFVPPNIHDPHELLLSLENFPIKEEVVNVSMSEIRSVLLSAVDLSIRAMKLTYDAFKNGYRFDLIFWTGISNIRTLESVFICPLLQYYLSKSNSNELPKSDCLVEDRVVWVIILLWSGLSFKTLFEQLIFSHSIEIKTRNTFKDMICLTARDMAEAIKPAICFPPLSEWIEMNKGKGSEKYHNEKKLIFILDGTSLPVYKPNNHAFANRGWWVHHKKHHAWRYFVCVTLSGKIVWVSNLYMGNEKDATIYKASGLREILSELYPSEYWDGWKLVVGGDKGYAFIIPPDGWELLLTKSAENETQSDNESSNENVDFICNLDVDFAIPRSVVERTIGLLKRWRKLSCGSIYVKSGDEFYHNLIIIACSFANHIICSNTKAEEYDESDE